MSIRTFKALALTFFFLFAPALSEASQCRDLLRPNTHRVPRTVRVMSYNVQNLYVQKGRYAWGSEEEIEEDPKVKEERHTREIARIITETSPDFIILQEVETWNSITRFVENYLGNEYAAFLAGDYEKRSISTVLLMKSDLKFYVRMRPANSLTWTAPSGNIEPVFSRELGAFEVYDPESGDVVLGLFGVHFKSHRDRSNDSRSFLKRSKEAEVTAQLVGQFVEANPNVPFIIAGDFNSNPEDKELEPLFEDLDVLAPLRDPSLFRDKVGLGPYTHSFHENGADETVFSEIDFILTSEQLRDFIIGADVYRYKDRQSNRFKPLPDNNEERNENPSDHFPVFIDIKPEAFYEASEIERNR